VDYVVYEGGKPYLSINEELYSIDDLDTVVDKSYLKAYNGASDFTIKLNKLPALNNITIATDGKTIDELEETYNSMSDYDKSFVATDTVERYKKYLDKLAGLRAAALTEEKPAEETSGT